MKQIKWLRFFVLIPTLLSFALLLSCGDDDDDDDDGHLNIWDQVRDGHWLHGVNVPWDSYGSTFGVAPWGYLGLGSQGPSGWRCETKIGYQGCSEVFWDGANSNPRLGVNINIRAQDENRSSALTFFWFDEMASLGKEELLDLSGQTVSCDVYFESGARGPGDAPNGAVLYVQDEDWTWLESEWWNIVPGHKTELSITLDGIEDFDATRVRAIGVKVATNDQAPSDYSYEGTFYVDNVTTSSGNEFSFTFDDEKTRTEEELLDMADLGITAIRWWVFADGRSGLEFDDDGFVTGLDDKFLDDFDEAIRLARQIGLYLVPVLFDFLLGAELKIEHDPIENVDYPVFGHSDLMTDPAKRQSLIDNAITPLFEQFGDYMEIVAWDLMNEPCWLIISDEDHNIVIPDGKRPAEIKEDGAVTYAQMKAFFSAILDAYPSEQEGYGQLFTIGSASHHWVDQWRKLGLDLEQFHLWNGPGQIDEGTELTDIGPPDTDTPTVIGEFTCQSDCRQILDDALALGYSGAWPWAYRAKDDYSSPMLGEDCRDDLLSFAQDWPDVVEFH